MRRGVGDRGEGGGLVEGGCKFFLLRVDSFSEKGFDMEKSNQDVTKVVSLGRSGRLSTKCIKLPLKAISY